MQDDTGFFAGASFLERIPRPLLLLLCFGCLAGAAFFAMKVPATSLEVVAPSIALALAAGVLGFELRVRGKPAKGETLAVGRSVLDVHTAPQHLAEACRKLAKKLQATEEDPAARTGIRQAISDLQIEAIQPVIDRRPVIIDQFGMAPFAHFMSAFSRGERLMQRARSALTDGHAGEALHALQAAADSFDGVPALVRKKKG